MKENFCSIMGALDESDGSFVQFLENLAEAGEEHQKQKKCLDRLFEKNPEEDPDGDFTDLAVGFIHSGFAAGYVFGQMFDLCDKEAAAAVAELKQKLLEEGFVKYQPKARKEGKEGKEEIHDIQDEFDGIRDIITTACFALDLENGLEPDGMDHVICTLHIAADMLEKSAEKLDQFK